MTSSNESKSNKQIRLFYPVTSVVTISVILLLAWSTNSTSASSGQDLYSDSDHVIRFNGTNFESMVFHESKNIVYMVQFYNSYCGHCQMFAPIYKDLASRIANWSSVVRVAGVDCSKDENVVTCSDNKIAGYPTIYLYPPNPRRDKAEDDPVNLRSLGIEWTVDDIEEALIDYLGNMTNSHRVHPPVIEAMQPVSVSNLRDFKRLYTVDSKHDEATNEHHGQQDLMFVIESEKSYLGRKLIVEYYRIVDRLELRRISLSNKELLSSMLTEKDLTILDESQPMLVRANYLDDDTKKAHVLVRGEEKNILPTARESERDDFIHNRFKTFFEHYYFVELKEAGLGDAYWSHGSSNNLNTSDHISSNPNRDKNNNAGEGNKNSHDEELEIQYLIHQDPIGSKRIFSIDLLKGISYMLTHEVKIKGDLSPIEFNTIRNLLTILKKYLPLDKWDPLVSNFIIDLRTRLDTGRDRYEKDGVKAQEMRDLLELAGADEVRLKYSRENWITCYESDRNRKGYTCSLWALFHSLTVGEYSKAAPVRSKPTLVLYTMRDYITKFLGCTVCSSNFEKETESLATSLNYRNSSVLWLWNTHNLVNQRLNNERASEYRKPLSEIIYPTPSKCASCYKTKIAEIGQDGKTYTDIQWNMANLFEYLIDLYKPERIVTPNELALMKSRMRGKVNYEVVDIRDLSGSGRRLTSADMNRSVEQWNIQSIFSTGDMSICLFLYLSCVVIVAIVCLALNPKWKRFNLNKTR